MNFKLLKAKRLKNCSNWKQKIRTNRAKVLSQREAWQKVFSWNVRIFCFQLIRFRRFQTLVFHTLFANCKCNLLYVYGYLKLNKIGMAWNSSSIPKANLGIQWPEYLKYSKVWKTLNGSLCSKSKLYSQWPMYILFGLHYRLNLDNYSVR